MAMTPVRIRLLWHPQPQFAGYLLAQHERLGEPRGVAIECVPLRFDLGPIEAVLSGDVAMAVASPAHILESGRAAELVMLLAIQQSSALVYPARRSAGIGAPRDLAGRRIGVWPGREDLELRWMLHRHGLGEGAWVPVAMGDTVAGLVGAAVDCAQMTVYHEVHQLEAAAGGLGDFALFRAADVDAWLLKDGLVARRDWVGAHPAETQAVVDAVLAGWTMAFRREEATLPLCEALRPDMSRAEHRAQLRDIRSLAMTGATLAQGLGYPDRLHMQRACRAMAELEGVRVCDPDGLVDERFWASAPAASRSAAW